MTAFATIKKLPRQRTLTEEGWRYSNPLNSASVSAIFRSSNRSFLLTFTTSFTAHHLLSVESGESLQRLSSDSVFALENMPPQKKVSPVYQGVA